MPKIVHLTTVHHVLDPRILYKQAASLARGGYEVVLVAQHDGDVEIEGVRIQPLAVESRRPGFSGLFQRIRRLYRCLQLAKAESAHVYHFHDPELIPVGFLLQRISAQVVYDVHEDYASKGGLSGRFIRRLERWCFSWVDHVVLAEEGYEPMLDGYEVPRTCVLNYFLVPRPHGSTDSRIHGSTDSRIQSKGFSVSGSQSFKKVAPTPYALRPTPYGLTDSRLHGSTASRPSTLDSRLPTPESLTLIYTGTISKDRGLMTMLRLMKLAKDNRRNWQLLLAGKCHIPDQRREAEDFIAQHELDDNVRLTGWEHYVPWQHMVPLYSRAHVGLALFDRHQNPEKSLLTKFYEYMHYGLPICCSEFARWKSFIEDFDVGFTVGFGDYSAAFSGLDRMISESDRYPRLSRNAAKEAPNYRWEVMEKRLLDMYRLLIHNPPTETS